jgi:hypothetical protein
MENNDFDYLNIESGDKQVLKHLSEMGEQLKKLKLEAEQKAEEADKAKKAYEHYANVILPSEMHSCGVDSIGLASGGMLSLKHNFYCQPNKNAEDRRAIVEWLREHDGGHIVEHDATVAASDFKALEDSGIPFVENTVVNTQKLKSFLKDGIGATTGIQKFTIDDIPKCVHFQEVTTVEVLADK